MTKEEKQLLLIDLCARLPHHVRCKVWLKDGTTEEGPLDLQHNYGDVLRDAFYYNKIKDVKPYLRPMSSMIFEERSFCLKRSTIGYDENDKIFDVYPYGLEKTMEVIDFLNAHHFDYRGLIEKGLALEAPEDMYKF